MPPIHSSATLSVYVGSMNPILKYNRRKFAVILLLTMVVFGLQQAKADFMSVLNQNNLGLSGTNFGTVTVSLSGQTATITFDAAPGIFFVDGSSAAVNLSTTSFTEAFVSETPAPSINPTFATNQSADGFGKFTLALDQHDASESFTSIAFTVTSADFTSEDTVLAFNSKGFDAAAHIRTTIDGQGVTGFVGEGPQPPTVPDGGTTAMLLGAGLSGLGLMGRLVKR